MIPFVTIFGVSVSTYRLAILVGVSSTVVLYCLRAKLYNLTYLKAISLSVVLATIGFLSSKGLYIIEHLPESLKNGFSVSGQSFFGILFFVPIAAFILGRFWGLNALESVDIGAPAIVLYMMFLRIGCMLNGCCGGIFIGSFQIPTQLIEALGNAVIFLQLSKAEGSDQYKGKIYPLLMISYGVFRFFLEFLRQTYTYLLGFSSGQVYSIISIIIGSIWLFYRRKNKLHEKYQN